MSHQALKPDKNPLSLHKKWALPEFLSLHFGPVSLTLGLPDAAYWTQGRYGTAALWAPDCDRIVTMGQELSRISAVLPGHPDLSATPEKMQNNSDGD